MVDGEIHEIRTREPIGEVFVQQVQTVYEMGREALVVWVGILAVDGRRALYEHAHVGSSSQMRWRARQESARVMEGQS